MPYRMDIHELDIPIDETPAEDDILTEDDEEEEALAEEHSRRAFSRFARGCLEVAVFLLLCAAAVFFLEHRHGLVFGYELPPNVLAMGLACGSMLSLVVGMFSLNRRWFASFVMIVCGWLLIFTRGMAEMQKPDHLTLDIPGTQQTVELTRVSTYVSTNLLIDEPVREHLLARRWRLRIHGRELPLRDLVELRYIRRDRVVHLYFEDRLWAVYDPETDTWSDVLHHDSAPEETGADG